MDKTSVDSRSASVNAFVAMCFDGRLQHIYSKVVRPVLENHGFSCVRADEICMTGIIIEQIREAITAAKLALFDLTFENPNVFYELGVAQVLSKPIIMVGQNAANIPFDVRHWRIIPYEDSKLGLLDFRDTLSGFVEKMFPKGRKTLHAGPAKKHGVDPDELQEQRAALVSPTASFRRYAIKFLGDCRDRDSYHTIRTLALYDSDPDMVREAFTSLYKIDQAKAYFLLLNDALRIQREFLVRERAVSLLGTYPPNLELVEQMTNQLSDTSWGVRQAACEALGKWCISDTAWSLQQMLSDSELRVRLAARKALDQLHEAKTIVTKADLRQEQEQAEAQAAVVTAVPG